MIKVDLGNGHEITIEYTYSLGYEVRFYEDGCFLMKEHYRSIEDIEFDYGIEL